MQHDAFDRLDMAQMLLEPEMLQIIQPDVRLVADLIALSGMIPAKTRDTAKQVVRRVVDELLSELAEPMRQAVMGALNRAARGRRPRHADIDWACTIIADTILQQGQGMRGSFSRIDTGNFISARGPDFRLDILIRCPPTTPTSA